MTTLTDEARRFVRYTHTRQWPMLHRFPVDGHLHDALLAQMVTGDPAAVLAAEHAMADEVQRTAARMLADPAYRNAVRSLPFRPDDRVVAVGDSVTADRLGWFELLSASITLGGTPPEALVNLGLSGDTTADALERFDLLEAARPTRVLMMLGTNDARLHGRAGGHRMVSPPETERNVRALIDLITRDLGAAVTVLTPTAVDQPRIDAFFADAPVGWRSTAVAEAAQAVRTAAPGALDLYGASERHGVGELLEDDGVHPTPGGQEFITARLVDHLVRCADEVRITA